MSVQPSPLSAPRSSPNGENGIEFIQVKPEEFHALREYSKTIDHDFTGSDWPVFLCKINGEPVGYFEVVMEPTIYPAISKKITPRQFLAAAKLLREKLLQHNDSSAMVVSLPHFTEKMLRKLKYFKTTAIALYRTHRRIA